MTTSTPLQERETTLPGLSASAAKATWKVLALRGTLLLAAVSLAAWLGVDGRFYDPDRFPRGIICLPAAMLASLLISAWGIGRTWTQGALWASLACAGQAAVLPLVSAGPGVRYQHLEPATRWLAEPRLTLLAAAVLSLQGALVAWGLSGRWRGIVQWLTSKFKLWQISLLACVFVLTSATLSRQPAVFAGELALASTLQLLQLLTVGLAAWSVPPATLAHWRERGEKFLADYDRWLPWCAACGVTVAAALLSALVYQKHPHIPDEVAYLLQARYFAVGKLALAPPPVPEAFDVDLIYQSPQSWWSCFPPGWPAALAVGVALGVPWLVNPVLAGGNVLLAHRLLRELYDERLALAGVLLLAVSPWHIFMAMNLMSHTLTLSCALVAAWGVCRVRRTGRIGGAILGGLALGLAGATRPLVGATLAVLLGLWTLGGVTRPWSRRLLAGATLAAATIAGVAPMLGYNAALTGSPLRFPLGVYVDRVFGPGTNDLGFGTRQGWGWAGLDPFPGHSPLDAALNADMNLFSLNVELLGWGAGSLLLAALAGVCGPWRKADLALGAVVAAIVGVHSLYWFSGGPDFGARYWYMVLVPAIALTIRGAQQLAARLTADPSDEAAKLAQTRVAAGLVLLCLGSLVSFFPWRALDKYRHYRGMRPDVIALAGQHDFGRGLVLVRGQRHPDYASAAAYNPVDLSADAPIFAWDRSDELRRQLLAAFADRPVWIVEGPSVTGDTYRVVAGPIEPENAAAITTR